MGLLTSPIMPLTFRCRMGLVDLIDSYCAAFKEWHSPWGYVPLFVGVFLIVAGRIFGRIEGQND
jgi:hypothetical protein